MEAILDEKYLASEKRRSSMLSGWLTKKTQKQHKLAFSRPCRSLMMEALQRQSKVRGHDSPPVGNLLQKAEDVCIVADGVQH